ncbi:MAG: MFS transporter [Clostridia bacterium]|nr:MFS transporter [Clostridia bacterium]
MTKIIEKKQIVLMYIFASAVYFMSYTTRINYNTVLVEISTAESISRSLLALPLTASFITYGLGQIISGWLGDKFDAFKLITLGLVLSAVMNFLLPLFPKPYIMVAFWAVNGFAQALIYPPLMKITSHYLSERHYAKVCLFVTIGSHAATLLMYLVSPVIITIASWKFVFFSSFGCAVVFLVIWQLYSKNIKRKYGITAKSSKNCTATEETETVTPKVLFVSSGLVIIMLAVIMQGFLRDGIATWMPAYLSDVFSLSNEISILTTVILPIFSIFSAYVILAVRNKLCRNELKLAGVTFLAAVAAIVLLLIFKANMPLSVLFLAFTSACSHAINFLLICLVPKRFEKYGRFSLVTGMINSCTYVGAAISTYGFAALSESCGWNVTLVLWGVIALTGFVCCFAALRQWNKV